MIDSLSLAITLVCLVAGVVALAATLGGRFRTDRFAGWLAVIEIGLVVQAVLAVVALLRGHRVPSTATYLAYLAFSLVVLPVAFAQVRGAAGRWAGAIVVAALLVQAVLVVRTQTTWRTA